MYLDSIKFKFMLENLTLKIDYLIKKNQFYIMTFKSEAIN